jgi:hypothetical protein
MARKYVFADESGNFDFSHGRGATRYFTLTTITLDDCSVGHALLELRRTLGWEGLGLNNEFHATTDSQAVRDRVFAAITPFVFRIDATIIEKSRTHPSLRTTDEGFYRAAWELHMTRIAREIIRVEDELLVVGASLGTRRRRTAFHAAIEEAVQQRVPATICRVASWAAASDPCLQVADYCCWAIQRKWERGDTRAYVGIVPKIAVEFVPFDKKMPSYY